MLFVLFIIINLLFVESAPINRVSVTTEYNVTTANDVMGCQTNISNAFNITVNLYAASSGNFVLCVTDEGGVASSNPIIINTFPGDLIYPGEMSQYIIESDFKTSCFYCHSSSKWIERRF